ncbi:MAG: metallophosphoesterase [Clostridia bacterium]|nr:metallophosphoesterase [Clostridia bacterium]
MTTILAFSDSHCEPLPQKLLAVANEADYVLFAGDGAARLGDILLHKHFIGVDGNCDARVFGKEEIIEVDGVRILLTHGDLYSVKRDLLSLELRAQELHCSAVVYGHTHFASIDTYRNITLICPGSIAYPASDARSYAYIVVHNGKLTAKIVNIS